MKFFNKIIFVTLCAGVLCIGGARCDEDAKSILEVISDGLDQVKDSEITKEIGSQLNKGGEQIGSLFFSGNDSQIVDLGGLASSGFEKGKDGINTGVDHVKDLFFNGDKSQIADVNKFATESIEVIKEKAPEIKEKSVGIVNKVISYFKGWFN